MRVFRSFRFFFAMQCSVCHSGVATGTCEKCNEAYFCNSECFAASSHACNMAPVAEAFGITLYPETERVVMLGDFLARFDAAAFKALRARIDHGRGHADYASASCSLQDDKMIYQAFAPPEEYELTVRLWRPNYGTLAAVDLGWIEREIASYSADGEKHVNPVTGKSIDHRIAWLAREERRALRGKVNAIASALREGTKSREECARELVCLNPLAVRVSDVIVAVTEAGMLTSHANNSSPALLRHTGYRRALLSIIHRSRSREDSTPVDFHRFLQQRHLLEFGGPFEESTYSITRAVARANAERFFDIIRASDVIDATRPSVYTWNRPHRVVADRLLLKCWEFMGRLVDYMAHNTQQLELEFQTSIAAGIMTQFVDAYKNGRVFLYEWLGPPDEAWAWTTSGTKQGYKGAFYAGYGLQLRDATRLDELLFDADAVVATVIHEMSHTFARTDNDPRVQYPVNWFTTRFRDPAHSPLFVRAERAMIDIALRVGLKLPEEATRTVREFEDYIDDLHETPKKASALRRSMDLPDADETGKERTRPYDDIYRKEWTRDRSLIVEEIDDGDETTESLRLELQESCRTQQFSVACALLKHPLVDPSEDNNYALRAAVDGQSTDIVKKLLEDKRVVEKLDESMILHMSYMGMGHALVDVLRLQRATHIDLRAWLHIIKHESRHTARSLFNALMDSREYIGNALRVQVRRLLFSAIDFNNPEHLNVILAHPMCEPEADDNEALVYAVENAKMFAAVRLLSDRRIDPCARNNFALVRSAELGLVGVLRRLLAEPGVDPSANGNRALLAAHFSGHDACYDLLAGDTRVDKDVLNKLPDEYVYVPIGNTL